MSRLGQVTLVQLFRPLAFLIALLATSSSFASGASRTFRADESAPWVVRAVRAVSAPDLEPFIGQETAVEVQGFLGGIEISRKWDDNHFQLVQETMGSRRLFVRFPDSGRRPVWLGWGHPLDADQTAEHWDNLFHVRLRDGITATAELKIYDKAVCMNDCLKANRKLKLRQNGHDLVELETHRTCFLPEAQENEPFSVRSIFCFRGGDAATPQETAEHRVLITGEPANLGAEAFRSQNAQGGNRWFIQRHLRSQNTDVLAMSERWMVQVQYIQAGDGHPWHSRVTIFDRSLRHPAPRSMRFYRLLVKEAVIDAAGERLALVSEYQGLEFRQSPPDGQPRGRLLLVNLEGAQLDQTIGLDFRDILGQPANISHPQFQFSPDQPTLGYILIGGAPSRGCRACGDRQIARVDLAMGHMEPVMNVAPGDLTRYFTGGQAVLVGGRYALVGLSGGFTHRVGTPMLLINLSDGQEIWRTSLGTFPPVDVMGSAGAVALSPEGDEIWIADIRGSRGGFSRDDGFISVLSVTGPEPRGLIHRIGVAEERWTLYGEDRVNFSPQTRELFVLGESEILYNFRVPRLGEQSGAADLNRISIFNWDFYRFVDRFHSPNESIDQLRVIQTSRGPELMVTTSTGPVSILRRR